MAFDYIADKFGGLGSLLDVGTVGDGGVVKVGLGVLPVGDLQGREEVQTEHSMNTENREIQNAVTHSQHGQSKTHAALILGYVHGVLDVGWDRHLVVYGLALFLLKLGFVHFL